MSFPTDYQSILNRIDAVDPVAYGRTRNYLDGAVTRLSPYISRGVISTKMVMERTLSRGFSPSSIEKFIQELAWRDHWQLVWKEKGKEIDEDLRHPQEPVAHHRISRALPEAHTGIEAIDGGIQDLVQTGYLHNHLRMYTAAIACNMGRNHWRHPAQWMYFHLLDGDWASNALSWQWVAGSNANKKYVANQDNINKYCGTQQKGTFLDVDYSEFEGMPIPEVLRETVELELHTRLPETPRPDLLPDRPTYLYNWYNLDPNWADDQEANRILLLEPSVFAAYPIAPHSLKFMLDLGRNIPGLQVYTAEFAELKELVGDGEIHYKEHPLNRYEGVEHSRDWMFSVGKAYRSFFSFWKKAKKEVTW